MGILPAICLLVLLSLNSGDATRNLKDAVIPYVVRTIQEALLDNGYPRQMSFLMVLDSEQSKAAKSIFKNKVNVPQEPEKGLNLITDLYNGDLYCSEYKLLNVMAKYQMTPAMMFGEMINNGGVLAKGGSVIFYSTNSPCTHKCFGDDSKWNILSPLINQAPFDEWANRGNIDFYFVYLRSYAPITYLNKLKKLKERMDLYDSMQKCTRAGFKELATKKVRWNIVRCDPFTETLIFGDETNDYASNWPDPRKIKSG